MSSRGRGSWRGGRSTRNNPSRLRGLFSKGIWRCDCNPRYPADHFQVKKEGPNKGRWFYTCQNKQNEGGGCGFFLWEDDAKIREEGAVMSNGKWKSEIDPRKTDDETGDELPKSVRRRASPPPKKSKIGNGDSRKRQPSSDPTLMFGNDDATAADPEFDMTSDEEQMMAAVEASTPRKFDPVTPSSKRKFMEMNGAGGLPTPKTGGKSFTTPSKGGPVNAAFLDIVSPASTPTPSRFRNAVGTSATAIDLDSLYIDIFHCLQSRSIYIGEDARTSLKEICDLYSRRTHGVEKGKEIAQLAVKARDAKIEELKLRIGALEAELETERAIVSHLRWEKEGKDEADVLN